MSVTPDKEPPINSSLAERAYELGWGPSIDRLEALAAEPCMEAQLGMLGLKRRLVEIGDEKASALLERMWATTFGALTDSLNNIGYLPIEHSALLAAANTAQPEA